MQERQSQPSRVSGSPLVEPHLKLFGDCSLVVGGNIHSRKPVRGDMLRLSSVAPSADCGPANCEEPDPVLHP